MRIASTVTAVLLLAAMALAQASGSKPPQTNPPSAATGSPASPFPFPDVFGPTTGLFDQFWNDPAVVNELHLTESQRTQLRDAALAQRLAMIESGADALKALLRLSAVLDADQLDETAYGQQMNSLATVTGKLVQNIGEMAVTPRRVLTLEQWRKLQRMQRAKRGSAQPSTPPKTPAGPPR